MDNQELSRSNSDKTSFDDLPSEATVNVFSRLPVKTLVQSTSVSKSWHSLITNPHFISAHLQHSMSCVNETAVLVIPMDKVVQEKYASLVCANTGYVFDLYEIPFSTRSNSLQLVGSVNGLLCLTDVNVPFVCRDLYFWSPGVRKFKLVDKSCLKDEWGEKCFYVVGLGFCRGSDDYRVVRILYKGVEEGTLVGELAPKVEVFSLKENEWREIENVRVPKVADAEIGVTVGGMVYWIGGSGEPQARVDEVWIMSFDFDSEVFGLVKVTDEVRYCLGESAFFRLMKFKDSLSVCVFRKDESGGKFNQPCCVWLMKREAGIVSWTIGFKVDMKIATVPLSISKSGTMLMVVRHPFFPEAAIVSCNLKSMCYKNLGFRQQLDRPVLRPSSCDTSFVESLVMLEGGNVLLKSAK